MLLLLLPGLLLALPALPPPAAAALVLGCVSVLLLVAPAWLLLLPAALPLLPSWAMLLPCASGWSSSVQSLLFGAVLGTTLCAKAGGEGCGCGVVSCCCGGVGGTLLHTHSIDVAG